MNKVRSPLFYVGDKYKLMPQLSKLFPKNINTFYDVFCGGGSASINTKAKSYILNDFDTNVIDLHLMLQKESPAIEDFIFRMHEIINHYGLSLSEDGPNLKIEDLKKEYRKTYFSKYNKKNYLLLRAKYNDDQSRTDLLYLLLVYGFNHMIRFNKEGKFNLPVGNVDWNKNVSLALNNYANWSNNNKISFFNLDFEDFLYKMSFKDDDFLYFDPPYLITFSDYNKFWNLDEEKRLYNRLDYLNSQGITWGISNMLNHKGKENKILLEWSKKYRIYNIESNYISRFDNSVKKDSKEIYVTNYSYVGL